MVGSDMELDSSGTAVGSLSNQKFLGDEPQKTPDYCSYRCKTRLVPRSGFDLSLFRRIRR